MLDLFLKKIKLFFLCHKGISALSYGLIISLIATASISTMDQLGISLNDTFCRTSTALKGRGCTILSSINSNFNDAVIPEGDLLFTTNSTGTEIGAGWSISSGNVDILSDNWRAVGTLDDGEYSIDLVGKIDGALSKTMETIPGQKYIVTFDYSKATFHNKDRSMFVNSSAENSSQQNYTVDGLENFRASQSDYSWNRGTYTFTASDISTTIDIGSLNGSNKTGVYLKNITISK